MSTGSFIEMFMTTFGWHLYEIVWGVISTTGLAYLPFFAVIIDNIISPVQSQEAKAAAVTSLRRLEIDVIRLIIMMMLAVSPYMTIEYGAISHTKACQGETGTPGGSANAGESGTAFDEVFEPTLLNNQEAKAPPWFYLVMSVSGGINDAVITRLPCEMNMRQAQYEVSMLKIKDPHVKRQTQRFVTECYRPATADFYNNRREMPEDMPMEDLDWPGSEYFNDNYYRDAYSENPVPGFDFDASRESDKARATDSDSDAEPEHGYPSCHEWWNDSEAGLRTRLVSEVPTSARAAFANSWVGEKIGADKEAANDAIIREALKNEGEDVYAGLDISGNGRDGGPGNDTLTDAAYETIGSAVGTAGAWVVELLLQPVLFMVKEMAPYIQATMLMGTYFLLPWVLLVGNYTWSTIKTATITIFAMKFWTSIWAVVDLLDNKMAQVIATASGKTGLKGFFDGQSQMMQAVLDMVILGLYMGLPFYFLSILGWGGERGAGAATQQGGNLEGQASSAGSKGSSMAEGAATSSLSR